MAFGADFHMYYMSADRYMNDQPLYVGPEHGAPYVYPPFAAFCFQLLHVLPMGAAAGLTTFLNTLMIILIIAIMYLASRIIEIPETRARNALLLALAGSAYYMWNNISISQINVLILLLTVLALFFAFKDKYGHAAFLLSIAAWLKVIPVFILFWLFIKRPSWKIIGATALATAICIILPIIPRGFEQGFTDLVGYYDSFLNFHLSGKVDSVFRNQNLAATIWRITVVETNSDGFHYHLFDLSPKLVKNITRFLNLSLIITAFGLVAWKRKTLRSFNWLEPAFILLTAHLISGLTWRGHLLTFIIVLLPLCLARPTQILHKVVTYGLITFFIALNFIGRDLLGYDLYHYISGYGILTWGMLLLYLWYAYLLITGTKDVVHNIEQT